MTHWAVQFSVHREGLVGPFGPGKVSPQCLPLQVLICKLYMIKKRLHVTCFNFINFLIGIYIYIKKTDDELRMYTIKRTTLSGASCCLHMTHGMSGYRPTAISAAHLTYFGPSSLKDRWTMLYSFSICVIHKFEIKIGWMDVLFCFFFF